MTNRIAMWVAVLPWLAGCIIVETTTVRRYRTDYMYEGPITEEGQVCVVRCENRKERCRNAAESGTADHYKQCEEQAQDEYETCAMRTTSFSERRLCYRKSCPVAADYINCESSYRACFEGCGGLVWSRQVCEANC